MPIEVKNLSFSYGDRPVLHDISFSVEKGEFLSILGPNGVGKSTLFRCVLGLLSGYTGTVCVDGVDARTFSIREAAKHIAYIPDATVATAPEAYRTLGKLLGREAQAEELAVWCEDTYAMISAMMAKVDADGARKTLLYRLGDKGVNVIARGSFHAETINLMSDNLAVIEDVVSSGAGNEVDLEQILLWDPDVLIFAPDSCYDDVAASEQWQSIAAVDRGDYYKTPSGPYGWLSSPPAVQRYLGMLWLGELLYPGYTEYDLQEKVTEYYKLFYGCDLTDAMYQELMADSR